DALRRNLRLRICSVETGLLPGQTAGQTVSEPLRPAAQLRGDQLHVPPAALRYHVAKLGGGYAPRLCIRREGEHADHPYSEVEKRRGGDRAVPENDRPAAHRTAAGPGSVPVAARGQVRRGAAAQLSGPAARRPPLCL